MLQHYFKNSFLDLLLIVILLCTISDLQAQQFTPKKFLNIEVSNENVPKLLDLQTNEYQKYKIEGNSDSIIHTLIALSQLNRISSKYDQAYNYAGEALFLAEESNDSKLLMLAHEEYGLLYYLMKQDDLAEYSFTKALDYAKQAHKEGKISHKELYPAYYGILIYHQRKINIGEIYNYIDTCQSFIDKYNWGIDKQIYMQEKTAFALDAEEDTHAAIKLLKEVESEIITNKELFHHKSFLIIIQGVIANKLMILKKYEEANEYFSKALSQNDMYGEHTFYREYLHTIYASCLSNQHDYKNAYTQMLKAKEINNKYLNPRKESTQGFLSIKNRYKEEIDKKNETLQRQKAELAHEKAKSWGLRVLFFIFMFTLIITVQIIRRKKEIQKHKLENDALLERRKYNEALIDKNNKELTASTLQLIEKDEIIKSLEEYIKKEISADKSKAILKTIEQQSNNLWNDFNNRFMAQNTDFYERLQKTCSNLSSSDLKICALIKLNFSGKEMAYLLGISESSVHVARHRLRKKFNLDRETNLTQYVNSI